MSGFAERRGSQGGVISLKTNHQECKLHKTRPAQYKVVLWQGNERNQKDHQINPEEEKKAHIQLG